MSKGDPFDRDLLAGEGIYDQYSLCIGSLPRPRYVGGSGEREKIEAWFTEGLGRPQAWALGIIRYHRYPTQGFEEALSRDPVEQRLIVEAIEWLEQRLHADAFSVELNDMAKFARAGVVGIREHFREPMILFLKKYLPDMKADSHVVDGWLKMIEDRKRELRGECLPPKVQLAHCVLLACCRVRLAICSQDMAETIGQAINVGIEYGRMVTQFQYGEEVARDRATSLKRGLGSYKGGAEMKARSLTRRSEEGKKYQAAIEELMARRKLGITSAREQVARKEGVLFSRVKSLTVNPSKKTGRKA